MKFPSSLMTLREDGIKRPQFVGDRAYLSGSEARFRNTQERGASAFKGSLGASCFSTDFLSAFTPCFVRCNFVQASRRCRKRQIGSISLQQFFQGHARLVQACRHPILRRLSANQRRTSPPILVVWILAPFPKKRAGTKLLFAASCESTPDRFDFPELHTRMTAAPYRFPWQGGRRCFFKQS